MITLLEGTHSDESALTIIRMKLEALELSVFDDVEFLALVTFLDNVISGLNVSLLKSVNEF